MIKFFRKIRQRLLREGRLSSYLIYALGEIVLVVVGILIALQINTWNEDRKERKLERSHVEMLMYDLSQDSLNLAELVGFSRASVHSKQILREYHAGTIPKPDSLSKHFLQGVWNGITNFVPNEGAIGEIQNAGGLTLFKDEKVRNQILLLYNAYDRLKQNEGANYVENREEMRRMVYSKANGHLFLDWNILDEQLLLELISDSELKNRLVNNYAVSYYNQLMDLYTNKCYDLGSLSSVHKGD
jgi:hypothetical protein